MTAGTTEEDGGAEHLDDVFALLGNETRMSILRALWDEQDPFASTADNSISFTELRERVGASDPGRFNYHLNELVDEFVRRTESGYVLRPMATHMLRAAVVRSGTDDVSIPPGRAEDRCPFCGGAIEVSYADERLTVRCTECAGDSETTEPWPDGTLMGGVTFPQAGLEDRQGQELWEAFSDFNAASAFAFLRGVCPECAARPTVSVDACLDHATDGICEECGSTQAAWATVHCGNCTAAWHTPAWIPALTHPEVIGFFHDRGFYADAGLTLDAYNAFLTAREAVRSADPLRLEVTVELDGGELPVVVDDELSVVEVRA